jgi:hypothetical protein
MKSKLNKSTTEAIHRKRYVNAIALKSIKLNYVAFDKKRSRRRHYQNDNVPKNLSSSKSQ